MTKTTALAASAPWVKFATEDQDWNEADPKLLGSMLSSMVLVRTFEEKVLELAAEGLVHGPAHSAIGQEGGAAGSALAMGPRDQVNGSHRAHHQFLAKSLHHLRPDGLAPQEEFGEDVRGLSKRAMAEIMGLDQGFCRGRGGSMHLRWLEAGNLGTNAIVGGRSAVGGRGRLGPPARGRGRGGVHLFRRRRGQHRLGPGDDEPGSRLEAAAMLLHREQPLRRLHHGGGIHRRASTVRQRARLCDPRLEGGRHGPAGRPSRLR